MGPKFLFWGLITGLATRHNFGGPIGSGLFMGTTSIEWHLVKALVELICLFLKIKMEEIRMNNICQGHQSQYPIGVCGHPRGLRLVFLGLWVKNFFKHRLLAKSAKSWSLLNDSGANNKNLTPWGQVLNGQCCNLSSFFPVCLHANGNAGQKVQAGFSPVGFIIVFIQKIAGMDKEFRIKDADFF